MKNLKAAEMIWRRMTKNESVDRKYNEKVLPEVKADRLFINVKRNVYKCVYNFRRKMTRLIMYYDIIHSHVDKMTVFENKVMRKNSSKTLKRKWI